MDIQMYTFGHWIYFDKATGEILYDTGEVQHVDPEYESKRDPFSNITKLIGRDPESVGIIKLLPRELEQDFNEGILTMVNPETLELEFIYPNPDNPEEPQMPQPSLTEQVAALEAQNAIFLLDSVDKDIRLSEVEQLQAQLTLELIEKGVL